MSTLGLVFISLGLFVLHLVDLLPFHKDERLEVLCTNWDDRGRARKRSVILEEKSHPNITELIWEQASRQLGVVLERGAGPPLNLLPDLLDELVLGLLPPSS